VVSDTHGLVRPLLLAALRGVEHIIHAGDVGTPEVLDALSGLAPVTAVRGNNDRGPWARALPLEARLRVGGVDVVCVHDVAELRHPPASGVVVSGHSHRPGVDRARGPEGEMVWLNPGSAGPRRFRLPVSCARLVVRDGRVRVRLVTLEA
jgi:putative phosphoesterase